jgi:surface antigen
LLSFTLPCPDAALAANLSFLGNAPISRMTQEDIDILYGAAVEALDSAADGEDRRWENPKTRGGGTLTPLKTYPGPGGRCRDLQIENSAGGLRNRVVVSMCEQADGALIDQPPLLLL